MLADGLGNFLLLGLMYGVLLVLHPLKPASLTLFLTVCMHIESFTSYGKLSLIFLAVILRFFVTWRPIFRSSALVVLRGQPVLGAFTMDPRSRKWVIMFSTLDLGASKGSPIFLTLIPSL